MRIESRGSFLCTLALAVFVGLLIVSAFQYPQEVRLIPLVIGGPTLGFLLVLLLGEFYPGIMRGMESTLEDFWVGKSEVSGAQERDQGWTPWSSVLRVLAWIVGFFTTVFFLGFFLVPPFFIAAFLIVEGEMRPLKAIACSLTASLALYAGMGSLRVDLWMGAVPEVIPGYLGGSIIPPM